MNVRFFLSPETGKQLKCKAAPIWHQKHGTCCVGLSRLMAPERQSLMAGPPAGH